VSVGPYLIILDTSTVLLQNKSAFSIGQTNSDACALAP
jgi:hypothetical protein